MSKGRLHQGLRRHPAVFGQDGLLQGAAVDSDTDGNPLLAAGVGHRLHPVLPADVARIDAHFVAPGGHALQGQPVIEMDVRHQRDGAPLPNGPHRPGGGQIGHRHPHNLAPRRRQTFDLLRCGGHIVGAGVGHGLNGDRSPPSDGDAAHANLSGHRTSLPTGSICLRR